MLQNVLSFFTNYLPYFQMALGVWQILKVTPPAAVIKGVMGRLLSLALPGFFPAYEQLRYCPGYLFKTVKCVVPLTQIPIEAKWRPMLPLKCAPQPESMSVDYLGETFTLDMEGKKVFVNGKMSYFISGLEEWQKIRQKGEEYFGKEAGKGRSKKENNVVFVKGCKFIWQKVATGKIMEFGEVLDYVIFENNDTVLMSDNIWFLPVDLSEKSEEKLPKLLNLVGLFFGTYKKTSLILAKSFTIASAILEIKPVSSCISSIINKMFCRLVQYICNKLPYAVRRFVYLLFIWVENLMPRNDIQLKVVRRDSLDVFIGGAAKTNSPQEATLVDWLDYKQEYEFRCGCSIVMKATYDDRTECKVTVQHTSAVFLTVEEELLVKCYDQWYFTRIGTFLWCLSTSKAGSLIKYDCNDNKVHVRGWRESLRHYEKALFPVIYKLTLQDVIV